MTKLKEKTSIMCGLSNQEKIPTEGVVSLYAESLTISLASLKTKLH